MILLSDLKAYLGIEPYNTSEDALLTTLEANAVAFIETQTRRYFGPPDEVSEIIRGIGTRDLWLDEPPIEPPAEQFEYQFSGSQVLVDERQYPGATAVAIEENTATGFEVRVRDHEGKLVRLGGCGVWQCDYEYTVTYWRGYPAGEEPKDIRQLVLDLVSIKSNQAGEEGVKSETIGGYSYTLFGTADLESIPTAFATLASWKRLVYA